MSETFNKFSDKEKAISALKSLTIQNFLLEAEIEQKMYQLQIDYQDKFRQIQEKQNKIIHGGEVVEADCEKFPPLKKDETKENVDDSIFLYEKSSGFKNFWLTALKNDRSTNSMIRPVDEPVLEYLTQIEVKQINPEAPFKDYSSYTSKGVILEFHFSENPYFSNKTLYKYFKLESKIDPDEPFEFEGLMPVDVEFSEIQWKQDKNITIRHVKKTQKNKKTKQVRVVTKTEKVESFFNFFGKLNRADFEEVKDESEVELVLQSMMLSEYDLVTHIQTEFIPKVILYYLGEIEDDEDEDDDFCSDEDCDSEDESEEEMKHSAHGRRKTDGFLSTSPHH